MDKDLQNKVETTIAETKKQVEIYLKLKNLIELSQDKIKRLNLKNKACYDYVEAERLREEAEHLNAALDGIKKQFRQIEDKLAEKREYFNISLLTLISAINKQLQEDYPDRNVSNNINIESVRQYTWGTEKGETSAYEKEYATTFYAYSKDNKHLNILHLPTFKVRMDYDFTKTDLLMSAKVNLLESGLIGSKYESFGAESYQNLFWTLAQNNIRHIIVSNDEAIERALEAIKRKCENVDEPINE